MYKVQTNVLQSGQAYQFRFKESGKPLTFGAGIDRWINDAMFQTFFNELLAKVDFEAFYWELPALTYEFLDRQMECVVVNSPALTEIVADRAPFDEHFHGGEDVVAFQNFGRDALMIVPCPVGPDDNYAHIGTFVRNAPERQRDALWTSVGKELKSWVGTRPLWLNTAGMGVSWLHVRLDSRPKYYKYAPYRSPDYFQQTVE